MFLVNNVGRMYDFPDELSNVSEQLLWDIVNINIGAVTMMTRMVINDMKQAGRGAIVNISSGSELQPLPFMAVYAASKVSTVIEIRNQPFFKCILQRNFYVSPTCLSETRGWLYIT